MKIIDTHSHFNLSQFDKDREAAIARMVEAGVGTFCVGTTHETSRFAVELAQQYQQIWAIVGQHPTEWCEIWDSEVMRKLARSERVVAIGECGLDYYRERERGQKDAQQALFRAQIELAIETALPLMLHIRPQSGTMDAYDDAIAILKEYSANNPSLTGTAHFFVGDKRVAQEFLDLGFYISFSGVITIFPEYEDIVRFVPLERILPETDAPFAAPLPWRGTRCEPQYVLEVVQKIVELKGVPLEEIQAQLFKNTRNLFGV